MPFYTQSSALYYWLANQSAAIPTDSNFYILGPNTTGIIGNNSVAYQSSFTAVPVAPTYSWAQISLGLSHATAIRSDGLLFTWGSNLFGELGNSTQTQSLTPIQIGNSSWTLVSAGAYCTYGITIDGLLYSWGLNSGMLGDNTTANKSSPVQIGNDSWVTVVASASFPNIGVGHVLAIRNDGLLFAWGSNVSGKLGDNTTINRSSPVQIGTSSWSKVSVGTTHSAAIRADGLLYTWGYNLNAPLGDNTTINRSSPVQIGTSSWIQISAGGGATAAIAADRRLFYWGLEDFLTTRSWKSISANDSNRTYGVDVNGNMWTWGFGGPTTDIYPRQLFSERAWDKIYSSQAGNFAIATDGTLWSWGDNSFGSLGLNDILARSAPVQVGNSSWIMVSVGKSPAGGARLAGYTVAGITSDYRLFAWGTSRSGEIGDNNIIDRSSPVQIGTSSWTMVSVGATHVIALRSNGSIFTWGFNSSGQLGINQATSSLRSSPVQLGTSSFTAVSAGPNNSFAIRASNRALFAWGLNSGSQTIPSDTVSRSSPTQVSIFSGGSSWVQIEAGSIGTIGLAINNLVYAWGTTYNFATPIGVRSFPVQIGVKSIIGGTTRFGYIQGNDILAMWGLNSTNQIGPRQDTSVVFFPTDVAAPWNVNRSSPTQIGTNQNWDTLITNGTYTMTVDTTGQLYELGKNPNQLYTLGLRSYPPEPMGISNVLQLGINVPTTTDRIFNIAYRRQ